MYIMTESRGIINLDHFQGIEIREHQTTKTGDSQETIFCLLAIGKEGTNDCPVICYNAHQTASASLYNLYSAIEKGELVWNARFSVDPNERKEITLRLGDCIQDMETMQSVSLRGAKLVGTPLQVGMIFESIKNLSGSPDVASGEDLELLKICEKVLEYARGCPPNPDGSGYYIDPNKSGD